MKDAQKQQIAAEALKALQLRRRLESGAITREEYVEALHAVKRAPQHEAAPASRETAQPARATAAGKSGQAAAEPRAKLLSALEVLQLRRRLDNGQITPSEYLTELQAQTVPAHLPVQKSAPVPESVPVPAPVPAALPAASPEREAHKQPLPTLPAETIARPSFAPRAIVNEKVIPERSLAMKCPTCSADIGINDQTKELSCDDCGAEIFVERKDCTIALRLATDLLDQQREGAAPGALAKPENELKKLMAEAAMVANVRRGAGILGGLCGMIFAYMGIADLGGPDVVMGASVLICGSALLGTVVCITRHTTKVRADLAARIRVITATNESGMLSSLPR